MIYPLKSIIDLLLTGVGRIPSDEREDALCSMFAGLLPAMSEADIAVAREQVIARLWAAPETAEPVVELIDGHVTMRHLLREMADEEFADP